MSEPVTHEQLQSFASIVSGCFDVLEERLKTMEEILRSVAATVEKSAALEEEFRPMIEKARQKMQFAEALASKFGRGR